MNLYELTKQHQELEDLILGSADQDTGEIPANEDLDRKAEELGLAIDSKLDGISRLCRNFASEADALRAEEKRLADRRRALENREKSLKAYAKACLEGAGLQKLHAGHFVLAIQKNGGVAPLNLCVDLDPAALPERFRKVTITPDSAVIRQALEAGEVLGFAELGERGTSLRIR